MDPWVVMGYFWPPLVVGLGPPGEAMTLNCRTEKHNELASNDNAFNVSYNFGQRSNPLKDTMSFV